MCKLELCNVQLMMMEWRIFDTEETKLEYHGTKVYINFAWADYSLEGRCPMSDSDWLEHVKSWCGVKANSVLASDKAPWMIWWSKLAEAPQHRRLKMNHCSRRSYLLRCVWVPLKSSTLNSEWCLTSQITNRVTDKVNMKVYYDNLVCYVSGALNSSYRLLLWEHASLHMRQKLVIKCDESLKKVDLWEILVSDFGCGSEE